MSEIDKKIEMFIETLSPEEADRILKEQMEVDKHQEVLQQRIQVEIPGRYALGKATCNIVTAQAHTAYGWVSKHLQPSYTKKLIFLDSLKNGGVKGDGLKMLSQMVRVFGRTEHPLVMLVNAAGPEFIQWLDPEEKKKDPAQAKLLNWYMCTGLVRLVPKLEICPYGDVLVATHLS